MSNNKLPGIAALCVSFLSLLFIFIYNDKLILQDESMFVIKYSILISFVNACIFLFIMGILIYKGDILPYFKKGISKYDRAKTQLLGTIISIPFLIVTTIYIFVKFNMLHKVMMSAAIIYMLWLSINDVIILLGKKNDEFGGVSR